MHPHAVSESFERAVGRSKLPRLSLHGCRHTDATLGLAAGVSPGHRAGTARTLVGRHPSTLYTPPGGDEHADAAAGIAAPISDVTNA